MLAGRSRDGRGKGRTVQTGVGPVRISVPRDRDGTFEPTLVPGRAVGCLDDVTVIEGNGSVAHGIGGYTPRQSCCAGAAKRA
jgi:hypothetical protein